MAKPEVTAEERQRYLGREVTMTVTIPTGDGSRTITRHYRVVDVTRFGPNRPLMLQVGSVKTIGLGTVGTYVDADSVELV